VNIFFDAKLIEIDIESVRAVCEDGRDFSADVIIGADGMPLVLAAICQTMTELHRYRLNDQETHRSNLWCSNQGMAQALLPLHCLQGQDVRRSAA